MRLPAEAEAETAPGVRSQLSPTEAVLVVLWEGVLRRGGIGREDNFFDLGGHSLLATQLVSRIRDSFAVELPLAAIFTAQTLREMAVQIAQSAFRIRSWFAHPARRSRRRTSTLVCAGEALVPA